MSAPVVVVTTASGDQQARLKIGPQGAMGHDVALDAEGQFSTSLTLAANRLHELEAVVTGAHGQTTTAHVTVTEDERAPRLVLSSKVRLRLPHFG